MTGHTPNKGRGQVLWAIMGVMALVIVAGSVHILNLQRQIDESVATQIDRPVDQPADPKKTTVQINNFQPQGVVSQHTNFAIIFSAPVVDTTLIGQDLTDPPLRFNPEVTGKARWSSENQLKFFTEEVLPPSTAFTVKILATAVDNEKFSLIGETRFEFSTKRISVKNADLRFEYQSKKAVRAKLIGKVEFNHPVEIETFRQFTSVRYNRNSKVDAEGHIGFQLVYPVPTADSNLVSTVFDFETVELERGDKDQHLVLRIEKGLKPVGGHLGLQFDYTSELALRSRGELVIENAFPSEGNTGQYLQIEFNTDVEPESLKPFMQIRPVGNQALSTQDLQVTSRYRRTLYVQSSAFKPGNRYRLEILSGLTAVDDTQLKKTFQRTVEFAHLNPSLHFLGDGMYLARDGQMNVGLATINVEKVQLEIYKVFLNNVNYLAYRGWSQWTSRELGQMILSKELEITSVKNDQAVTPISLANYIDAGRKGIFLVKARKSDQRWLDATRWVVVTDLGIIAKRSSDELQVWVNSLQSLKPVSGVTVKLVSKNNQTLLEGKTDARGYVNFTNVKQRIEGFERFLITAQQGELETGDDFSFIQLDKTRISLTDFRVGGAPYLADGYEAFLYSDRGIYRPGERANLVAVVRDQKNLPPPPFPMLMQVLGPEQRIFREMRFQPGVLDWQGSSEFQLDLPPYAKTGGYTARLMVAGKEIGRQLFRVEEFMPDRIKVKVDTPQLAYQLGQELTVEVEGVNLFGPPAAGFKTAVVCDIEADDFRPTDYASFTFGDPERSFKRQRLNLGESELDENGKGLFLLSLPAVIDASSSLKGIISSTVSEPGGRAVSAYKRITIHPYTHYVGLRVAFDGYAQMNEPAKIEFVAIDQEEQPVVGRNLQIQVFKLQWHSILRRDDRGRYRYQSEKQPYELKTEPQTSTDGIGSYTFVPSEYGEYRVVVRDLDSGSRSSIDFYTSGWGYSPWAMDNPDRLDLVLDKTTYRPGETAQVQIKAPFAGKLLLTVEQDRVLEWWTVSMPQNSTTVKVPIKSGFSPNAYISAILIRSVQSLEKHAPARAFGVVPFRIDVSSKRLQVDLKAPTESRPNQPLSVDYRVQAGSPVKLEQCRLTVAAVDEGILQLTDFQTPDAQAYFFRQRRLGTVSHDLYASILPEVEAATSQSSTGGDGIEAQRKKRLSTTSVQRVKPVALWSGLVTPGADGTGSVTFDLPQFNGKLRLMAVAVLDDHFGATSSFVTVKDLIVLTPTFPRFLAGGDRATIPVRVFNGTGRAAKIEVNLTAGSLAQIQNNSLQSLTVVENKEQQIEFVVAAQNAIGAIQFNLTATDGDAYTAMEVEMPLRPAAPLITRTGTEEIVADRPGTFTLPADLLPSTERFEVSLSPFPMMRLAGGISYLLRYPHGCIEQTTSRVFPLLYFSELAQTVEPKLFKANKADYFVTDGIAKLESMMMPNGYFSYWPGGSYTNHWGSIYASHFLVEARKAGYQVSDRVYNLMLTGLRQETRRDFTLDSNRRVSHRRSDVPMSDLERVAYACYVLAAAQQPETGTMNYLKSRYLTGYSLYQLAGSFGQVGNPTVGLAMIPATAPAADNRRETGGNFNSPIRSQAIMLDILSELSPNHASVPTLVKSLMDSVSNNNRWHTTQENAFAFLSLGKILKQQASLGYTGTMEVNGQTYQRFNDQNYHYGKDNWSGAEIGVQIEGDGKCYLRWVAEGIPSDSEIEHFDKGIQVRRRYLTEDGTPITDNRFPHGSLVVAEITVKALEESLDNVVVTDVLPAGFEIENPRIESRAGIPWIQDQNFTPSYIDIRDDRLIFFGYFKQNQQTKFYYALRAVTEGRFALPPVAAEAMYDPFKSSVWGSGSIEVIDADPSPEPEK